LGSGIPRTPLIRLLAVAKTPPGRAYEVAVAIPAHNGRLVLGVIRDEEAFFVGDATGGTGGAKSISGIR
jgi:hypothetical protein